MKKKTLIALMAVSILSLLLLPRASRAGDMTGRIRTTVDKALAVLRDPAMKGKAHKKERRARLRASVEGTIDFEEMTRRSLGVHWRKRTPAERREFVNLFSDLLENSYISKIEQDTNAKVYYLDERMNRKGTRGLVKTKVVTSKDTEIPIFYRMMKKKGRWVAYDIVIEGVSLVSNYRTQFGRIIHRSSYEDLVKTLRKKVAKVRSDP